MRQAHVEVLYFAGCPNYRHARELVQEAARELGLHPRIELVEVEGLDRVQVLRFLGSPTVHVDGRDVEPGADAREDFALACRVYRSNGAVLEVPDPGWIREALVAAAAR